MSAALMFLGLTAKAGHLTIGEDSCGIVARAKKAKLLLTASDASDNSRTRARNYADASHCPCVTLPYTKFDLGSMVGRGSPGMLAITDINMADAFMKKLAAENPGQFTEECGQLDYAAQRALQRKKEAKKHQENLKRGKKKTK